MPTPEEAKRTIEFTKALAEFLFVLPSKGKRRLEDAKGEQKPTSI